MPISWSRKKMISPHFGIPHDVEIYISTFKVITVDQNHELTTDTASEVKLKAVIFFQFCSIYLFIMISPLHRPTSYNRYLRHFLFW